MNSKTLARCAWRLGESYLNSWSEYHYTMMRTLLYDEGKIALRKHLLHFSPVAGSFASSSFQLNRAVHWIWSMDRNGQRCLWQCVWRFSNRNWIFFCRELKPIAAASRWPSPFALCGAARIRGQAWMCSRCLWHCLRRPQSVDSLVFRTFSDYFCNRGRKRVNRNSGSSYWLSRGRSLCTSRQQTHLCECSWALGQIQGGHQVEMCNRQCFPTCTARLRRKGSFSWCRGFSWRPLHDCAPYAH